MKYTRLIIATIMIGTLILLMVYSAQEYSTNSPQIKKYQHMFKSSEYVNNSDIEFRAQVISVNQTNHTIHVSIQEEPYNYPRVEIFTRNLSIQGLKKGDLIDVLGIIRGKNQVTATKIWVNEPWKDALIYIRSLSAIPFVLYLFFRTWKFDITTRCFQRRNKNA